MLKKGFLLVTILGFVGTASASQINLFWSTTGISDPNLMYSTALTDFQPVFVPPTPTTGGPAGAYDLFLWGQFPADWAGAQILGLDLEFQGDATHDVSVAYRQAWGTHQTRWDGSAGIALDGVMAAVAAGGGIIDTPGNLVQADGAFLIGVARAVGTDGQVLTMDCLGIACRDPNGNGVVPTVTPATFWFDIPEPASVLLVLAGALSRRR
jgi:hypothetical protein